MNTYSWKDVKPDDGYFAALNIMGELNAELVFGLYVDGELYNTKVVDMRKWINARVIGEMKQNLIFWEGVAEFMNAGGNLFDVSNKLRAVQSDFDPLVFSRWSYFDTGINENGNRVHEFISDNPIHVTDLRFVRWVRGEFIDCELTEQDMLENVNHGSTDTPTETEHLCEIGPLAKGQTD